MSIQEKILALSRQLYPKGRAFKMPLYGNLEKLHRAISESEAILHADIESVLNSALPDNNDFSADDASAWERRLGLITNENVSLSDRKLAIQRKMNHPGNIPARQASSFLEYQLQSAGFDVYVYENIFDDGMGGFETRNPLTVNGNVGGIENQHGDFQHGDVQHGLYYPEIISNHIDAEKDLIFDVGPNLRSTIFIGGNPIGSFADVAEDREPEFRQLILRVKPVHITGYLFINYI
jgi:hypothetical protein